MSRRARVSVKDVPPDINRMAKLTEILKAVEAATGVGVKTITETLDRKLYGSAAKGRRFADRVGAEKTSLTASQNASAIWSRRVFFSIAADCRGDLPYTEIVRFLFPECDPDNLRCGAFRGAKLVKEALRKFEKVAAQAEIADGIYDNEKLIELLRDEAFETRPLGKKENCLPDDFLQGVVRTAMAVKKARRILSAICTHQPKAPKTPDDLEHYVSLSAIMSPQQLAQYVGA